MTANQFRQALRVYLTRDTLWIVFVLWLLPQVAPLILLGILPELGPDWIIRIFIAPMFACDMYFGMLIGRTLSLHFGYPQTRLLPDFATAHVAAIGAIVAAAVLIRILIASRWAGIATSFALGALAMLGITAGVSALWPAKSTGRTLLGLFPSGVAMFLFISSLVLCRKDFVGLTTDYPILFLVYGGVGLLFLATLPRRIQIALEHAPERSGQEFSPGELTSARTTRLRQKQEGEAMRNAPIFGWLRDGQFDFVFRGRDLRSPWGRLLLRQLISGFAGVTAIPVLGIPALLFSFMFFILSHTNTPSEVLAPYCVFMQSFMTLIAMSIVLNTYERAWPCLAMESLRPLDRRELIRDLFRSCACDLGVAAAVHCAIVATCWKLWLPDAPPSLLLPWLALTIATYVVGYGALSWLASFGNLWVMLLGVFTMTGLSSLCIYTSLFGDPACRSPLLLAPVLAGAMVAAVFLYRTAFRRWCHVDLG